MASKRIDYIDLIKGAAIFLVVWAHTWNPHIGEWYVGTIANVLFFFCSGMFFRPLPWVEFVKRKPLQLLVPFIGYYLLALPCRLLTHLAQNKTFQGYDWTSLLDLFSTSAYNNYLRLDIPLWFLISLFTIQLLSTGIFRLPKWAVFITALPALALRETLYCWPTMFMFNFTCYYYSFFAFGWLFGKPYVNLLHSPRKRWLLLIAEVIVLGGGLFWLYADEPPTGSPSNVYVYHMCFLAGVGIVFALFSFLNNKPWLRWLRFLGVNTLIIMCVHIIILNPITQVVTHLTHSEEWWYGALDSVLAILFCIPVVWVINRYFPILAGKPHSPRKKLNLNENPDSPQ